MVGRVQFSDLPPVKSTCFDPRADSRVPGMCSRITRAKLARVDEYEVAFHNKRVTAMLAALQCCNHL
jgi:hypothetical protein